MHLLYPLYSKCIRYGFVFIKHDWFILCVNNITE